MMLLTLVYLFKTKKNPVCEKLSTNGVASGCGGHLVFWTCSYICFDFRNIEAF